MSCQISLANAALRRRIEVRVFVPQPKADYMDWHLCFLSLTYFHSLSPHQGTRTCASLELASLAPPPVKGEAGEGDQKANHPS